VDALTFEVDIAVIVLGPALVERSVEGTLADFLRGLPARSGSKTGIDHRLISERDGWGADSAPSRPRR
jgi:hypothetical protein